MSNPNWNPENGPKISAAWHAIRDTLAAADGPINHDTLIAVACHTGIVEKTADNLLRELSNHGYLRRDRGCYRLADPITSACQDDPITGDVPSSPPARVELEGDFPCCTTPAPVGAAVALDLDARGGRFATNAMAQAKAAGVLVEHPGAGVSGGVVLQGDAEIARLRSVLVEEIARAESAEAEVVTLRARVAAVEALVNNGQTVGWIERDGTAASVTSAAIRAALTDGCDNTTHVCSCWPSGDGDGHDGDCNIWLNDSPAMTAPEPTPTAEHIDAVADLIAHIRDQYPRLSDDADSADVADAILTSTDPAVHAAMLDALVRAGNDAEMARRLEWATGLNGRTLLVAIRSEGLEVVRVKPEQVAP